METVFCFCKKRAPEVTFIALGDLSLLDAQPLVWANEL